MTVGGVDSAAQRPAGQTNSRPLSTPRSLLLVDCGSVYTKLALVALVDDHHRLLARVQVTTTASPPYADIGIGVRNGCAELTRLTGRPLLVSGAITMPEQDNGAGVDAIALATSVGGALRLLTAGPGREALTGLLYKSIGGLFVQPATLPPAPPPGAEADPEWRQVIAQMRALHPHAAVVVGIPPGGMRGVGAIADHAESVARWLTVLGRDARTEEEGKPLALPVVFSGTTEDGVILASTVRSSTPIVHTVEPLTPNSLTPLNRALTTLYESVVLREVPGYSKLRAQAVAPATATLSALGGVVRFLAQQYHMNVTAVDVGASSTVLSGATAQGDFMPASLPQGGVGPGAGHVLRAAGAQNILRWISLPADENTVREYALTRMLRPRFHSTTALELELEYAFAREAIRLALYGPGSRLSGLHPLDVLLGTGGVLTNTADPAIAALLLLDAIQPRGITSLALDMSGLVPMLGSVATFAPEIAAEVTESDAVPLLLGSIVSVAGAPIEGQPMVRIELDYTNGQKQSTNIEYGTITRIKLAAGERALLSLYPGPSADVGLGPGQQARASEPIDGGELGVIVDARGRPLTLPSVPAERMLRLAEWRRALGIQGAHT